MRVHRCRSPRERSLFSALVTQRRAELQLAAEILGRRIYAENPESLWRAANRALLIAKRPPKNRTVFYSDLPEASDKPDDDVAGSAG